MMKSVIRFINPPADAQPLRKVSELPVGVVFTGTIVGTSGRWPGLYARAGQYIFSITTPGDWFHASTTNDMTVENFKQVDITVEVSKVYDQG